MRKFILSVILLATLVPVAASAEQILPDDLHSLPILIEFPHPNWTNNGTGVFLQQSNRFFLATAAHVIFNLNSTNSMELRGSEATLSFFDAPKDSTNRIVLALDLHQLLQKGRVRRHLTHDVAVINMGEVINSNRKVRLWHGVSFIKPGGLRGWNADDGCKKFNDIPDGNETYILGYPVELLQNNPIAEQVDFTYPLVRKGIISQRNHNIGKLIIDSGVYGGNSGGPVIAVNHPSLEITTFTVAGIVTQFVPVFTRPAAQLGVKNTVMVYSGYSVAEPIDYALELMRKCP